MNNLKNVFFLITITVCILTSCKTNYNIVRVDLKNKPNSKNGFYYYLPKNYLKINITVEKQDFIKGPYSEYAKQYFSLTNVINSNSSLYKIKDINIETFADIDTANIYFVETNDTKLKINYSETGLLSDVNYINNNEINTSKDDKALKVNAEEEIEYPVLFRKFADLNMYEKIDTVYKRIKLDTSFIIEKTFKTSMVEKPTELKVKEIAEYISKIKEAKFNIISGEVDGADKKNLEFMYQELQYQEEQYLKLFTGITINKSITYSFIYYPVKDSNKLITNSVLCKFSPNYGITNEEGNEISNISIQLNNSKFASNLQKFNNNKSNLQNAKHGFYYCFPSNVKIDILQNNNIIYSSYKDIAQFGTILSLPNKKVSIQFDKTTGSIKFLNFN